MPLEQKVSRTQIDIHTTAGIAFTKWSENVFLLRISHFDKDIHYKMAICSKVQYYFCCVKAYSLFFYWLAPILFFTFLGVKGIYIRVHTKKAFF